MSFSKPISGEDPIVVTVNVWIHKNWQLFVRRADSSMAFKPPRRRRRSEPIDYTHCDDISEMSQVPLSTVNQIFKDFVLGFTGAYFKEFVKFPEGQRLEM